MASYVTRLSDIIVPDVFAKYLTEDSVKKTSLYTSGILADSPALSAFLAGGGTTFDVPFFQRLSGNLQVIQSNYTIETNKATTAKMVARRLLFTQAWSAEELASVMSGEDAMSAIQAMVEQYWEEKLQGVLASIVKGTMDDNKVNDASDLIHDIALHGGGTPGATNKINGDDVIDAVAKMGDKFDAMAAIAMHSTPYFKLVKDQDIAYIQDAKTGLSYPSYKGLRVVVTDELTADTDGGNPIYWNIIFKPGAIQFAESSAHITPVETYRNALKSEDVLITRRQIVMHPVGFKWADNSVAGNNPIPDELEDGGNWDRVFNKKNCGFAVLKTNG